MPVVTAADPALAATARRLATRLGLALAADAPGLRLRVDASGLSLILADGAVIRADFVDGRMGYRRQHQLGKRQPLARALGLNRGIDDIVDATAGLGRDAFVLAATGAKLRLLERSPVVAALLEDGLRRASAEPATAAVVARMQLCEVEASGWLRALDADRRPQAVFLDPMYPSSGKSAQVKKEMQGLRQLLGPDTDSAELLAAAIAVARRRVVVKRPRGAAALAGPRPSHCVESPNTRYDVYLRDASS